MFIKKLSEMLNPWSSKVSTCCETMSFKSSLHYHMGFHGFFTTTSCFIPLAIREKRWLLADDSDPARQATMKGSQPTSTIWRINKNSCDTKTTWWFFTVKLDHHPQGFIGEHKKDMSRNPPKLNISTHPVIFEWYSSCLAHRLKPQAGRTARWWVDFQAKRYRIEPACFECLFNTKTLVWNVHLF